MNRAALLPLLFIAGCARRAEPTGPLTTTTTDAPTTSASAAPPPAISAATTAAPAPDPDTPMPSAYLKFVDELNAKCPRDTEDSSTAGMARTEISRANCVAGIIKADAARLPKDQLAVLLDGV